MALGTLSTLLLVAGAAAAGGQIAGGLAANRAANQQAGLQEEQARIALNEANRNAELKADERRRFLAKQRMAYLANGVSLAGTPGVVQDDTFKQFQMEIEALRNSGVAEFGLGMKQAAITKNTGRAQLISGFTSALGTLAQTGYVATSGLSKVASTGTVGNTGKTQSQILGFDTSRYR